MSSWGRDLLQSDDDYKIAEELGGMFGCNILITRSMRELALLRRWRMAAFSRKLDKIMSQHFVLWISYHSRYRMVFILVVMAMLLGAKVEGEHLDPVRSLAPHLRNMLEQLQLVTALDEYQERWHALDLGQQQP